MLKKTITYVDFNETEQKEDFYFNLSKVELTSMQFSVEGGMTAWLTKVVATGKEKDMLDVFQNFILGSVGVKSDDGRRFIKNDEVRDDFKSSPAYDVLFMELATDSKKAMEFMKGILPQDMASELDVEMNKIEALQEAPAES